MLTSIKLSWHGKVKLTMFEGKNVIVRVVDRMRTKNSTEIMAAWDLRFERTSYK